jgi:hypothetical protein
MLHLQKLCEFSLPQELYLSPDTIMKQPTLERFVCAYSRLQLARACLCTSDEITYDVQSSTQLLSHVAI